MSFDETVKRVERIKDAFLNEHPEWVKLAVSKDPALQGKPDDEVRREIMSYPGLTAVATYTEAHRLYNNRHFAQARELSEVAHTLTGIDIHPGAIIGENFFIDHGTGDVIGETAEVGKGTMLYHGVTLGAYRGSLALGVDGRTRRHPKVGDDVTISLETKILGGVSEIGNKVNIGPGCTLINAQVGEGSTLEAGVQLISTDAKNPIKVPPRTYVAAKGQELVFSPKDGAKPATKDLIAEYVEPLVKRVADLVTTR